jgi:hypothetical protein
MFEAYSDSSGDGKKDKVLVVAGYFGEEGCMRTAESQWRAVINSYLPHVPEDQREFHAKIFWNRDIQGRRLYPYSNWDDKKADSYIAALLRVIKRAKKMHPVAVSMAVPLWNALSHDEKRQLTGGGWHKGKFRDTGAPSKPYFLPFRFFVWNCVKDCKAKQLTHFYFDIDNKHSGYSLRYFKRLKTLSQYRDKLGDIDFPNSVRSPLIQCADLLSYELYQYTHLRMETPKPRIGGVLADAIQNLRATSDLKIFDKRGIDIALSTVPLEIRKIETPIQ